VVAASPNFFVLNGGRQEPVIAWRIGKQMALPITRHGCDDRGYYVLYPDGTVRPHMPNIGSEVPSFKNLEDWRRGRDDHRWCNDRSGFAVFSEAEKPKPEMTQAELPAHYEKTIHAIMVSDCGDIHFKPVFGRHGRGKENHRAHKCQVAC
jgi:hypothetical protein